MTQPLDMPDGPGWWGHDHNEHLRFVIHLPVFYLKNNMVHYQWGDDEHYKFALTPKQFRFAWPGKWYRLTMPWDEAQQPAIPPDVRETIREALGSKRAFNAEMASIANNAIIGGAIDASLGEGLKQKHDDAVDAIDAAMFWLDQQDGSHE